MVDINALNKYNSITEALKQVYNPNLREMAAFADEKKFFIQAVESLLEENFATIAKGVTTQLEKDKAFIKQPYKAKNSWIYYPLDEAGNKTSLPGGDTRHNALHRVPSIAAKDIIHTFLSQLAEKIKSGGTRGYGYDLIMKNCVMGNKANVCTPEGWLSNPLNANNSYVHYFIPHQAMTRNVDTGETSSTTPGVTTVDPQSKPRKAGAIQLLNVNKEAKIILDFTSLGEIELISPADYL